MIEFVRDLKAMKVPATFLRGLRKITVVRAQTVIFNVRSWKMRIKFDKFLLAIMKRGTYND